MTQTQQQRNVEQAAALGFTEIAPTAKYMVFDLHAKCVRTGGMYKLYLGRRGAMRVGPNVSTSRPCSWQWLESLAERQKGAVA